MLLHFIISKSSRFTCVTPGDHHTFALFGTAAKQPHAVCLGSAKQTDISVGMLMDLITFVHFRQRPLTSAEQYNGCSSCYPWVMITHTQHALKYGPLVMSTAFFVQAALCQSEGRWAGSSDECCCSSSSSGPCTAHNPAGDFRCRTGQPCKHSQSVHLSCKPTEFVDSVIMMQHMPLTCSLPCLHHRNLVACCVLLDLA